jgi:hypothetical protein
MTTCVNCGEKVETAYCAGCGQRSPVKAINFSNLWSDFAARIYGFDGMFPRTLRDLTWQPGVVARQYIAGNRVKYYGPVGYFFLMLTLYLLLASILEIDLVEFAMQSAPGTESQGDGQRELSLMINQWMNDNIRTVSFIIASFTVFFTWLFFRKSGYNFIESAVLIFFVNGHIIWLSLISFLTYKMADFVIPASILLLLSLGFQVYAFVNLYTYQQRWKIALKGIAVCIVAYVTMFLVVSIYMGFLAYTDKDIREKLRPNNNKPATEQLPTK